jgi:anti-sigma B factor antagonist
MTTRLKLSTRRGTDGPAVVTAVGETDMSNADSFRDALGQAAPEGGRFVVDLTGVPYLDSAGLNVLFVHMSRIQLIASPLLAPLLTISGLSDITSVREPQDQERSG